MQISTPHHIIAIGASAGGMEEINCFFDNTPLDGVSYVIVQHLSQDFKSRMLELLDGHSKLAVLEAEDGMMVKSNQVYLIPNDKFMTIQDNTLHLTEKDRVKSPHLTINTFFTSLALNSGSSAIGVILSGLGADGTEGVKAIKKAGGMVIARNPEATTFSSMPSNAIATGLVDFVLEPELMPSAIEDYIEYGGELILDNTDDEKNILSIINLIREKSPLDFSEYKQTTILRRTKRRAVQGNFSTLEKYLEFLKETPEEVEALAKDFLISVTSFFRDEEAFDFIEKTVLPDLIEKLPSDTELKMWVSGCATGEEVYSLAILIAEQLTGDKKDTIVKIFATDIDTVALAHAGKGVYNPAIVRRISPERLEKYFIKEGNNYRIKPAIRKMVIFAQHDLVKNPPYCNMHFISCRNLLIYMAPALQKKIFTMLLFGLKLNGYLFLGSSENPLPIIKNLQVVNKKWKIYKNLETKRELRFDTFLLPELLDIKHGDLSYAREDTSKNLSTTLADAINETLVSELSIQVICIDENNHVIKSYGDTSNYLFQKNFNSNLEELLPKPLAVAFNIARTESLKTNKKVTTTGIKVDRGQEIAQVTLTVNPLIVKRKTKGLSIVTFSTDKVTPPSTDIKVFDEKRYFDQYTVNMEDELQDLKDKLNSAYEQLDALNENMQSFNEELLSANEEMQSSNEEMQSVNEELDTINSSYQLKNRELVEMNDDLNNYFRSNINGQLIVNNELRLMKFSPGAVNQINLLETDIGRPLSNISTNIKLETIIEDVKQVLSHGQVITKEIETKNGRWYQIMTMPYVQQADNKTNGAIITFNDITALKKAQLELDKTNKSLLRINADLDNFVHVASHDLLAPLNSIEGSIGVMNALKISDPEATKLLEIINSSLAKFRVLIKDIAAIGKLENEMLDKENVDLEELVKNIEWSLEDKIKTSGAVIIRDLQVKHILFSKKNMRSIMFNLVSNGIKFASDRAPVIYVKTTSEPGNVTLCVQDNGIGMSKADMDTIFEMYGRLHAEVEGQGIGLSLVKKIVDASGGNITVESEPGRGSKFILSLVDESVVPDLNS